MLHAFRLGPIPDGTGVSFVYAALEEDGDPVGPVTAGSDAEGLRALLAAADGRPIRCEPALEAAGKALGLDLADLPEPVLLPRALLAFGLAHPLGGPMTLALHERFLEACAALWQAAPWKAFRADDALQVELASGSDRRVREVSVLGADGEGFGLVLYDAPGSTAQVTAAIERGRVDVVRRVPGTAVLFDAEPAWAAAALEAAFDLPSFPTATRIDRKGKKSVPATEELHALAAALAATIALVDSAGPCATREVTVHGVTVGARVERPDPARPAAAPRSRRSGTGRKARAGAGAKLHQLKVSLTGVDPPIWRLLRIPSAFTVGDLSVVLQVAFGWHGASSHEFKGARGVRYAEGALNEWGAPAIPEDSISLADALPRAARKLVYVLQGEDEWRHEVLVEKILTLDPAPQEAVCVAGARAGPIDGCGGAWAYGEFVAVLADPEHEDHGWRSEWAGEGFDPEAFSAEAINVQLRGLRAPSA